jgi:hypothetical protein
MRCEASDAARFGTFKWSGTVLSATETLLQDYYEDPLEFKGFRFADLREKEAARLESLQHQMVALDPTYMLFGYGRNAWCVISYHSVSLLNWTFRRVALVGSSP